MYPLRFMPTLLTMGIYRLYLSKIIAQVPRLAQPSIQPGPLNNHNSGRCNNVTVYSIKDNIYQLRPHSDYRFLTRHRSFASSNQTLKFSSDLEMRYYDDVKG